MSTAVTPIQDTNALIAGPPAKKPDLRDKAIDIKGKQYVQVSHRIIYFNETYPEGSIVTELISTPDAETVVIKATVWPDRHRQFTGYSQATWGDGYINKTSALENAETSAVGRALAFMGIGVLDSIASVDEINKAKNAERNQSTSGQNPTQEARQFVKKVGRPANSVKTSGVGDGNTIGAETITPTSEKLAQGSAGSSAQVKTETPETIANDNDVPSNISSKPTKDQMDEIKKQLKSFGMEQEALKTFVLKETGRESAREITYHEWQDVLKKLASQKS